MSNPQRGGDYVVRLGSDGKAGIYLRDWNIRVATFADNTASAQVEIGAMLAAAPQPPSSPVEADSGEVTVDACMRAGNLSNDPWVREMVSKLISTALTHRLTAKPDHSGVPSAFERLTVTRENGDTITGYVTPQYAQQAMLMPTERP